MENEGASVTYSALLASLVSICMLTSSWLVFGGHIEEMKVNNLKALSAGMILAATSELYVSLNGFFFQATLGMLSGCGLLYAMKWFNLSRKEEKGSEAINDIISDDANCDISVMNSPTNYQSLEMTEMKVETKTSSHRGHQDYEMKQELHYTGVEAATTSLSVSSSGSAQSTRVIIPFTLVFPICVDSVIDGILIGTTSSISERTGTVLAMVQVVEMSVLGLVLGISVKKVAERENHNWLLLGSVISLPPVLLFLAALISSFLAHQAQAAADSTASSFLAGFAVVQLTYLACFELLSEAMTGVEAGRSSLPVSLLVFLGVWLMCALNNLVG